MNRRITDVTRRRIIRSLAGGSWFGDLDEVAFLERLFPIDELPSYDGRYTTVRGDIIQHCIANYDWPEDWIFTDDRFGLATDDTALLAFLAEMLHPTVRDDSDEAARLATSSANCWLTTDTRLSRSMTSVAHRSSPAGGSVAAFPAP